ncbi:coiled-coil domain-containing protein 14 [Chanos chanos]|uniref:Coiled-coil domain-containing protein 14 n=1 Tax=Chanos chanos TaxID=29144 RepID=A0A6J2W0L3_CHACN|nr:coiled-coil domain-containing protein 14 [Chanos chanos]
MARQGFPKHKVVSSGRLTSSARGQINKRKVSGRHTAPLEPAYSLYSTDSEDQVTVVNKGLDRCAALLNCILEAEKTENKPSSSKVTKAVSSKPKSKLSAGKNEAEKERHGKKSSVVAHPTKRPAPVQKTILSSRSYPGFQKQSCCHGNQSPAAGPALVSNGPAFHDATPEPVLALVQTAPLACPLPGASGSLPSSGPQTATVFNSRLTTSTPALSPQRPGSVHTEPNSGSSNGQMHHLTQHWATLTTGAPSAPNAIITTTVSAGQYETTASVAPPVQPLSTFTAPSPLQQAFTPSGGQGVLEFSNPHLSTSPVGTHGPSVPFRQPPQPLAGAPFTAQEPQVPVVFPQPAPNGPYMSCSGAQDQMASSGESSEDSAGSTSEEEDHDGVDTMPVRDTSCQTSADHQKVFQHKTKSTSPEKTARKVMTVKYLLGELKTLVANQDSEAVRLISEVEQSISLLPAMVGSTNIQAEIALALQPLRSENVQLRRRLRILNQQLMERERAERQARTEDFNLELVSLQSLNHTLQTQLQEMRKELEETQLENKRLEQALKDTDGNLQQSREHFELETHRIRMDVSEALAEMRNCQNQLEISEKEKVALSLTIQQREAEITRLHEVIRNLQGGSAPVLTNPLVAKEIHSTSTTTQLTKHVLNKHESEQKGQEAPDQVTESIKAYLQTLNGREQDSPPHRLSPSRSSGESYRPAEGRDSSRSTVGTTGKTGQIDAGIEIQRPAPLGTAFVPLRETVRELPSRGESQSDSPVRREGLAGQLGLQYLSRALDKLSVSNGLPSQTSKVVTSRLRRADGRPTNGVCQPQHARRCLEMGKTPAYAERASFLDSSLSACDIGSLASDWSVNSWSTFNTRDEQDFRNGLAALDASIASLQKTIKADLKR